MRMLSNAMHRSGLPLRIFVTAPCSSDGFTLIGALNRTLAFMRNEYFSKSGIDFVRPLKLGRNIEIRGPLSFGSLGSANSHTFVFPSTMDTAPVDASPSPRFVPCHHLVLFFQPLCFDDASVSSLNAATRDGNPHVRIPCARASALSTYTRLAHAHDVGGFHTSPPKTTTSSNFPHGDSSYRATYSPPSVCPANSTKRKSLGTCARASSARTSASWYSALPVNVHGAGSLYPMLDVVGRVARCGRHVARLVAVVARNNQSIVASRRPIQSIAKRSAPARFRARARGSSEPWIYLGVSLYLWKNARRVARMRGYLNGMKKCRFAKSRRPTDRPRSPRAREATKNRPTVEGGIRARARRPVDAEGAGRDASRAYLLFIRTVRRRRRRGRRRRSPAGRRAGGPAPSRRACDARLASTRAIVRERAMSRGMNAIAPPPHGDADRANAWTGPANANDEKLCAKFFSIHGCAYGADCHFLHTYRPGLPVPPRPAPLPYAYTMSDAMRPQVNEKMKTRLCRNFESPEGCRFGDRCVFAHGEEELRTEEANTASMGSTYMLQTSIEQAVLVPVPQVHVGAIVGKAGSAIAQVSATSGAKVSMLSAEYTNSDGNRLCRVVGTPLDVQRAQEMIYQRLTYAERKKSDSAKDAKKKPFKTKICDSWVRNGNCPFGRRCHYAHGKEELQNQNSTNENSENVAIVS